MARAKLMELCGGKPGAGRCDCRGGGGCGGAAGDGSKFWSELNIENHDIETILLV